METENSKLFNAWNLPAPLLKALVAMKFQTPTPIQAQAIPIALMGKDVIGCAQTGTGKTAAFCIPLLARLVDKPQKTALILTPTRELATQIAEVLKSLTHYMPEVKSTLLIGGAAMFPQIKALRNNPRIIIATPGRLMDHLRRRSVHLKFTDVLVLDEADRMLDMGFAPQLEEIQDFLPEARQTMLFSATLPGNIKKLAARYMKNPEQVNVGEVSMPIAKISHAVIQTVHSNKNHMLMTELRKREGSILIFVKTKHGTDKLADFLADHGFSTVRIHGDRSQAQRDSAVKSFREGAYKIMVATDVVSRGLDIPHIAHVINYDLPMVPEDYVHRIGRTARAGASGQAVCLLTPSDVPMWRRIARMYNYDVGHLKTMPREAYNGNKPGGPPKGLKKSRPARRDSRIEENPYANDGRKPRSRFAKPGGKFTPRGGGVKKSGGRKASGFRTLA